MIIVYGIIDVIVVLLVVAAAGTGIAMMFEELTR